MPQHGPPGNPHNEPPGLRYRRRELTDLEEAAQAGSTQARVRLSGARTAFGRQQEEYRRRLARDVGRRLALTPEQERNREHQRKHLRGDTTSIYAGINP